MKSYTSYADGTLVRLLTKGDADAFTEIYKRYWDKLFSIAANKVGDLSLSEELVQDIFLDLWKRRGELELNEQLGAYLAVAMKYKIIDARRRRSRIEAYMQNASESLEVADDSTQEQLSFEELKDRLAALVAGLPDKCQLVYRLSREAGLSQKEIASHLNIAEKTVESHLSRAVKSLKTGLNQFFTLFF